jgi:hypothetical protein
MVNKQCIRMDAEGRSREVINMPILAWRNSEKYTKH